ncbi:hypothetical protein [Methylocystis sp. S23]|jgi:hypothetical protein
MIRVLTYENFRLLDPRIEDAYRRRHIPDACDYCCRRMDDAPPRQRMEKGRDWLRQLVSDIEALAQSVESAPLRRRRSSRTVAANSQKPAVASRGKARGRSARR